MIATPKIFLRKCHNLALTKLPKNKYVNFPFLGTELFQQKKNNPFILGMPEGTKVPIYT